MKICERCGVDCCLNAQTPEIENTAEYCEPLLALIRAEAKEAMSYGINVKAESETIEKHLETLSRCHDLWHYENLFNEDDEEEEATFWRVLDELLETIDQNN